eukprot:TRINITY_DN4641_c0_g1_i1.p1 TRINITY_DN4641_c0_g1~~TRINITY_DN4641_c0_g1_i1.p1  ORF type:complete len:109 (+),score=17.75 TRINITY_DN4641_c0_g1_i1:184-510(+)
MDSQATQILNASQSKASNHIAATITLLEGMDSRIQAIAFHKRTASTMVSFIQQMVNMKIDLLNQNPWAGVDDMITMLESIKQLDMAIIQTIECEIENLKLYQHQIHRV